MSENNFRVCEEVQHNRVFVADGGGGRGGGRAKNASVYALSNAQQSDLISDPDVCKAFKYYPQYPEVMQGSQEGKRAKLWGLRAHFGANISMKIASFCLGTFADDFIMLPPRSLVSACWQLFEQLKKQVGVLFSTKNTKNGLLIQKICNGGGSKTGYLDA